MPVHSRQVHQLLLPIFFLRLLSHECWTTTAAIAHDMTHIRIGQMATCNGFRNPALLAKMASTVDVLSHGRLDLSLGAGWYESSDAARSC
jgi:alkanesulfonate monooxygenase SsuD/methylene tetrahydromethanopterin reductase-like flavin-dependent oxidoreductase (luciferase family)